MTRKGPLRLPLVQAIFDNKFLILSTSNNENTNFQYNIYQYIITKYGILKLNSTVVPSSNGYISQYTPSGVYMLIVNEINEIIISIIILKYDILPVLVLSSGYTVKYSFPPSGVSSGFALGNALNHLLNLPCKLTCENTEIGYEKRKYSLFSQNCFFHSIVLNPLNQRIMPNFVT